MTGVRTDQSPGMNPIRADLEAERDFLLRSLEDLEGERASGGIDDESYQRLHDDYTARAAAAIRALDKGPAPADGPPPDRLRRRVLIFGGIAAFAALAGIAVASALGARLPGQTSSGNTANGVPTTVTPAQQRRLVEAAVARNPSDLNSRFLLARLLEQGNDLVGALTQYDQIAKIQPANAEAQAQAGRIVYLTAQAAPADQVTNLVAKARARFDLAVALDTFNSDAHFFRAIVLANEFQDFAGAQNDLQHYLILTPNGQYSAGARQLLAQVTNALAGPPATSAPAPAKG